MICTIEHVGDLQAQQHHVTEIRRVLDSGGLAYLAAPNKWGLMEPHFRLPLRSWLPRGLADTYVRAMGKGSHYDCLPPSLGTLCQLTQEAGLVPENVTWEALQRMAQNNELGAASVFIRGFGYPAFRLGRAVIPTNLLLLRPRQTEASSHAPRTIRMKQQAADNVKNRLVAKRIRAALVGACENIG